MYQPYIPKYKSDSLQPNISKKTIEQHYNNHYLKYLNKLNKILTANKFRFNYPVTDIFENIDAFHISQRNDILYNAGGVTNHELYFSSMTPPKPGNRIIPEPLNSAIIKKYGSIEQFIDQFQNSSNSLVGSGYTFLALNSSHQLILLSLSNQDTPFSLRMIPIFCIDLWEHAYYLDYGNNRDKYIDNFIELINFNQINQNYVTAIKNK